MENGKETGKHRKRKIVKDDQRERKRSRIDRSRKTLKNSINQQLFHNNSSSSISLTCERVCLSLSL